jgi:hypothetical protein
LLQLHKGGKAGNESAAADIDAAVVVGFVAFNDHAVRVAVVVYHKTNLKLSGSRREPKWIQCLIRCR